MSFDKRFYGVYEGVVVNSDDPEKRGRVTLQVPQVTGFAETNWASAMSGSPLLYEFPYGSFQDFGNQTAASTTVAYPIRFNTIDYEYGITRVDNTKLTFKNYGTFTTQFSCQFQNSGLSIVDVNVWLNKNGVPITGSGSRVDIPESHGGVPGHMLVSSFYTLNMEPEDYVEIMWQTESTAVSLVTYAAGTTPATPTTASAVCTVSFAGNYRPKPGVRVGVMYLGGDPNFPIWTGEIS
jgi:hypothetical protein